MRTEKEIREQLAVMESIITIANKWGVSDSTFNAFHTVLEWVLQTSDESGDKND